MNNSRQPPRPQGATDAASRRQQQMHQARIARIAQHREKLWEELQQRRAEYASDYDLPLNYPAEVRGVAANDGIDDGDDGEDRVGEKSTTRRRRQQRLRTSSDFVNARLLEAGLPLGVGTSSPATTTARPSSSSSSSSIESNAATSLGEQSISIVRFIRDLEGTGCYDAVRVHLGPSSSSAPGKNNDGGGGGDDDGGGDDQRKIPLGYDVRVDLKEKKWYKLYIGGGVNSDDLASIGSASDSSGFGSLSGGGGGGATGAALSLLPKLQFETSASLLNLTGFADVSSASYSVDQTGSSSFRFFHDRPLCSYLSKESALYRWLMPTDPRTIIGSDGKSGGGDSESSDEQQRRRVHSRDDAQYALGGGSHATLGLHATLHDVDHSSTRSSNEFVRTAGARLANHARGAARGPGASGGVRPSIGPPEGMAGPYLFLDWEATLRDVLPRRCATSPFALDCSPEIAREAGTSLKHSATAGALWNGCLVDDRYDPTTGCDAHLVGEVAGPPGDVGFAKLRGGCSWHFPVELLRGMAFGVDGVDGDDDGSGYVDDDDEEEHSPTVIGTTLHSSFNCGVIRPLTFNGLVGNGNDSVVPSSDRFFVGGPGQLRGFMPAGIGPRASRGGSSVPGGDALGGDLFYTSTLAASIPFPSYFAKLRHNGARLFGFANAGTCVATGASLLGGQQSSSPLLSLPVWSQVLQSSRLSVGGGVSAGTPMGRFEATYAVPIRYGPRDARKPVQFGFGFSFG